MEPLTLGRIASFYYLKYQTLTIFTEQLQPGMNVKEASLRHRMVLRARMPDPATLAHSSKVFWEAECRPCRPRVPA